jgi:FkbM family methyltransferase
MKILDIGANEQNFYQRFCSEDDVVVAVEPNPRFKNKFNNVVWEQKAVSSVSNTRVNLYLGNYHTLSSLNLNWLISGRFINNFSGKTLLVETITIDDLIEKYGLFDHIKIDVEGHEDKVIAGISKKYNLTIQFEWAAEWFGSVSLNALKTLKVLGYNKFNFMCNGDFNPKELPRKFLSYEEFVDAISAQISSNGDSWGMILVRS